MAAVALSASLRTVLRALVFTGLLTVVAGVVVVMVGGLAGMTVAGLFIGAALAVVTATAVPR